MLLLLVFLIFPPLRSESNQIELLPAHTLTHDVFFSQIRERMRMDRDSFLEEFSCYSTDLLNWKVSPSARFLPDGWFFLHSTRFIFCWFGWMLLNWLNSQHSLVFPAVFTLQNFLLSRGSECAFWQGTVFLLWFIRTYEQITSSPSTCSWSSRSFVPQLTTLTSDKFFRLTSKAHQNGGQFFFSSSFQLAKDLRKWLSYVCRSRFCSLFLSLTFTHSLSLRCSLTNHWKRSLELHCLVFF